MCHFALRLAMMASVFLGGIASAPARDYVIHLPPDIPAGEVQMTHFTSGRNGGSLITPGPSGEGRKHELRIPVSGADTLEVRLYRPGYQFVTIYEPKLRASKYEATVRFQKLRSVTVHGKIQNLRPDDFKNPVVSVGYWGWTGLTNTNIVDGGPPIISFSMVPVSHDGCFSVDLPDLASDPLWSRTNPLAEELIFLLNGREPGNATMRLHLKGGEQHRVAIQRAYPDPCVFVAEKLR
jgi:hypothetical protein